MSIIDGICIRTWIVCIVSIYTYLHSKKYFKLYWIVANKRLIALNRRVLNLQKRDSFYSGNIALHKPAMQSSTFHSQGTSYMATLAVDGNADTEFWNGHCSSTSNTYEPWWAVDLQTRYTLLNIRITKQTWDGTLIWFIHSWSISWNVV